MCACRNAAGILVVYDMTDRASFDRAIRWLTELPSTMPADTVLVLVGTLALLQGADVWVQMSGYSVHGMASLGTHAALVYFVMAVEAVDTLCIILQCCGTLCSKQV